MRHAGTGGAGEEWERDANKEGARINRDMWWGGWGRKEREGREDRSGLVTEVREDVEGDKSEGVQDAVRKQYVQCITQDDRETTEQPTEV